MNTSSCGVYCVLRSFILFDCATWLSALLEISPQTLGWHFLKDTFMHLIVSSRSYIYNSFIKFKIFKLYLMCLAIVHTCLSIHHIHGDQREHLEELELWAVVSCQAVLGLEPRTFWRADSALTIALSPSNFRKILKKNLHQILGQRRPSVDPSQGRRQLYPATHRLVTNAMIE